MEPPWNLHQTCIINTIGPLQGNWEDLQNIPEKSMQSTSNLHGNSMEIPWNLHQTCIINTTEPLEGKWQDLQNIPGKSM